MKRASMLLKSGLVGITLFLTGPSPVLAAETENHISYRYERSGMEIQVSTICLDEAGNVLTGPVQLSDNLYYFGPDGTLQYGFANGYYTNELGIIQTGKQTIDGIETWFDETGALYQGFVDGRLYVDGILQTGSVVYEGHELSLTDTGEIISGQVGDTRYVDGQPVVIQPDAGYMSQLDGRWSGLNLTGYGTISNTGCFPTVAAMAVNLMTGSGLTPVDTGKALHDNGYYGVIRGNLLSEGTFSDGWGYVGSAYGVSISPLGGASTIEAWLESGGVVAASVGAVFVSGGAAHEILITAADGKGQVYVLDPLSSARNGWYSLDTISSIGSTEWWNQFGGSAYIGIK